MLSHPENPGIALGESYCSAKTKQVTISTLVLLLFMCDTEYSGLLFHIFKSHSELIQVKFKQMKEIERRWERRINAEEVLKDCFNLQPQAKDLENHAKRK